jgi:hypothetical protein
VSNEISGAVSIRDLTGLSERTPLCDEVSSIRVNCVPGVRLSEVRLGDGNDGFFIGVPGRVLVDGGPGRDSYTAANPTLASRVDYRGGDGFDHVGYNNADRGVRLSNDGIANDGRIGFGGDNIRGDVERLEGSAFDDEITAAARNGFAQVLTGGRGRDVLRDAAVRVRGGSPDTVFDMGRVADGADDIIGGGAHSLVDYSERTQPLNVTLNFGGADDGEQVEGDEIIGSNEFVRGGQAGDTIRAPAGYTAAHNLSGGEGGDTIEGADGADTLSGGDIFDANLTNRPDGEDTIVANAGSDVIFARDGVGDIVGCGSGTDTAELDPNTVDVSSSCETRRVGVLRLAPKALHATAGETARLKLSWRHPRSWRQLRRVTLRLYRGESRVGAVAISPRSRRIADRGALTVLRRSRLARKGKTVTARLALRLDRSLAGRRLRVEVETVDVRGARQLEPGAGSIEVSR